MNPRFFQFTDILKITDLGYTKFLGIIPYTPNHKKSDLNLRLIFLHPLPNLLVLFFQTFNRANLSFLLDKIITFANQENQTA